MERIPRHAQILVALVAALALSCRSLPPLPATDLSGPGSNIQQGQAVWKPPGRRPELAGELLLATNANRHAFIQFVKTPFAIATVQIHDLDWQIEFGGNHYARRGHGAFPKHFVWFHLANVLAGSDPPRGWRFDRVEAKTWRLKNLVTGESLEWTLP